MTTNRQQTLDFANRVIEHIRGSSYGQQDDHPRAADIMAETTESLIWRLIADGHRAAIARSEHDEARASMMRESVPRLRRLIPADLGVSADELFSIGYRAYGQSRSTIS